MDSCCEKETIALLWWNEKVFSGKMHHLSFSSSNSSISMFRSIATSVRLETKRSHPPLNDASLSSEGRERERDWDWLRCWERRSQCRSVRMDGQPHINAILHSLTWIPAQKAEHACGLGSQLSQTLRAKCVASWAQKLDVCLNMTKFTSWVGKRPPKAVEKLFRRLTSVNRFDSPFRAGRVSLSVFIQLKVSSVQLILLKRHLAL